MKMRASTFKVIPQAYETLLFEYGLTHARDRQWTGCTGCVLRDRYSMMNCDRLTSLSSPLLLTLRAQHTIQLWCRCVNNICQTTPAKFTMPALRNPQGELLMSDAFGVHECGALCGKKCDRNKRVSVTATNKQMCTVHTVNLLPELTQTSKRNCVIHT